MQVVYSTLAGYITFQQDGSISPMQTIFETQKSGVYMTAAYAMETFMMIGDQLGVMKFVNNQTAPFTVD